MRYVVVDVEATCWDEPGTRARMEIIEIGAVVLDDGLAVVDEFAEFVQPVVEPGLSAFCRELTSITQAQVDVADRFSLVFPRFLAWIGPDPYRLCSWGDYDVGQFRLDCERHDLPFPEPFDNDHVNMRAEFAARMQVPRGDIVEALAQLDLHLEGTHHRGIDDARNIARIAQRLLALDR